MTDRQGLEPGPHWEGVYRTRPLAEVSWYEPQPTASLAMLEAIGATPAATVIDVGGGASVLVDELVRRGFGDVTVLDVSSAALAAARSRLPNDPAVSWICADLLRWQPERTYDVWHDRAVFHFLTSGSDRERYREALSAAVAVGGHVLIGAFSPLGPPSCSGLRTARYDADALTAELPRDFALMSSCVVSHLTPGGQEQEFTWIAARRTP